MNCKDNFAHPSLQMLETWQHELADSFRNPVELLHYLHLDSEKFITPQTSQALHFPLMVPRSFAERMQKANPLDPLFLQVWPQSKETEIKPGFSLDPVGDCQAQHDQAILQKYSGRILLLPLGACALHCRYCFRRHYSYAPKKLEKLLENLKMIIEQTRPPIQEVILSGGDPLLLTNTDWELLLQILSDLPIRRLRIHSRVPVILPSRITPHLCEMLKQFQKPLSLVIHCNHPQELNQHTHQAFQHLRQSGIHLLNQSVLLAGINDQAQILIDLSEKLYAQGVLPYYIHQLDQAQGTHHFQVDPIQGREMMKELQKQLPGYLVPRYVQEQAGEAHKSLLYP